MKFCAWPAGGPSTASASASRMRKGALPMSFGTLVLTCTATASLGPGKYIISVR